MKTFIRYLCVSVLSAFYCTYLYASGTLSGDRSNRVPSRTVDQNYEYGKAVLKGKIDGLATYQYCVNHEGTSAPLSRKVLKPFKTLEYAVLAQALVDCERPEVKLVEEVGAHDFQYVLHYLNKRYRLKLEY